VAADAVPPLLCNNNTQAKAALAKG
jgi:hypothetical protein